MNIKLYEYAIELANAIIGTEQAKDHTITITLSPEHLAYRKIIGSTIYNQFTSQSAREVLGNVVLEHEATCKALDAARHENSLLATRINEFENKGGKKGKKIIRSRLIDNGDPVAELEPSDISLDEIKMPAV